MSEAENDMTATISLLEYLDLKSQLAAAIERAERAEAFLRQISSKDPKRLLSAASDLRHMCANGNLADYDDELSNSCLFAAEACDIVARAALKEQGGQ